MMNRSNSSYNMVLGDEATLHYRSMPRSYEVMQSDRLLKQGVWLYFLLLVLEGALRKWFFPSLATPLLIIRDPLALWLVLSTWKRGLLPSNIFLIGMVVIGAISIFTATLFGHGNLLVAIFGARILLLHFPLIFVIGRVFTREDVVALGRASLWMAVPMVILIAVQFYSPQSAWVNRGVGNDIGGAGFDGALGFYRPPGTFSFTNGNSLFFSFIAPYVLYFWFDRKVINRFIHIAATVALLLSIPLSISRTLLFQFVITLLFTVIAVSRKPQYARSLLLACAGGVVALAIMSQTSFFDTALTAFSVRFEGANRVEGGLEGVFLDRFLGGLVRSLAKSADLPLLGYGVGMGTNVGSMLLIGNRAFLMAEEEWGRIVGELGALLGIAVIILRLGLLIKISRACYAKMVKGELLPWMLLSFGFLNLAQGGWSQPTSLGFCTLIGGLIIASLRAPEPVQESTYLNS